MNPDAENNPRSPARPAGAPPSGPSQFILYQTEDGKTRLEVRMENDTVWLSLNQLADLFQRDKSVISKHIRNIFEERELEPGSVVANFATTAADKDRDLTNLPTVHRQLAFGAFAPSAGRRSKD